VFSDRDAQHFGSPPSHTHVTYVSLNETPSVKGLKSNAQQAQEEESEENHENYYIQKQKQGNYEMGRSTRPSQSSPWNGIPNKAQDLHEGHRSNSQEES